MPTPPERKGWEAAPPVRIAQHQIPQKFHSLIEKLLRAPRNTKREIFAGFSGDTLAARRSRWVGWRAERATIKFQRFLLK